MEKDDARKLRPTEQHERRRQVVLAHKRGRTRSQIAEEVGLSYTAVSKVITRFEAQGMAALVPRKRGRRSGEDRALTPEQEARMRCDAACAFDRQVSGALGFYAAEADQACLRAIACGGSGVAGYKLPEIARRAKAENAEIHWGARQRWSTPMCAGAALRPEARRRSR